MINFGKQGGEEQSDGDRNKKYKAFYSAILGLKLFRVTSHSEEAHVREKSWRERKEEFMKGT